MSERWRPLRDARKEYKEARNASGKCPVLSGLGLGSGRERHERAAVEVYV